MLFSLRSLVFASQSCFFSLLFFCVFEYSRAWCRFAFLSFYFQSLEPTPSVFFCIFIENFFVSWLGLIVKEGWVFISILVEDFVGLGTKVWDFFFLWGFIRGSREFFCWLSSWLFGFAEQSKPRRLHCGEWNFCMLEWLSCYDVCCSRFKSWCLSCLAKRNSENPENCRKTSEEEKKVCFDTCIKSLELFRFCMPVVRLLVSKSTSFHDAKWEDCMVVVFGFGCAWKLVL